MFDTEFDSTVIVLSDRQTVKAMGRNMDFGALRWFCNLIVYHDAL